MHKKILFIVIASVCCSNNQAMHFKKPEKKWYENDYVQLALNLSNYFGMAAIGYGLTQYAFKFDCISESTLDVIQKLGATAIPTVYGFQQARKNQQYQEQIQSMQILQKKLKDENLMYQSQMNNFLKQKSNQLKKAQIAATYDAAYYNVVTHDPSNRREICQSILLQKAVTLSGLNTDDIKDKKAEYSNHRPIKHDLTTKTHRRTRSIS